MTDPLSLDTIVGEFSEDTNFRLQRTRRCGENATFVGNMALVPDRKTLKQALKEALAETLHEEREFLHDVFAEVLEDCTLDEAIREGLETPQATREEVFNVLEGRA